MDVPLVGFFRLAKNASKYSNHHKYKIGAVISNKKPIGIGFNVLKTHPKFLNGHSVSIHAEVKAILNAGAENCKGGSIFIYREKSNGTPAMAKPCKFCSALIKDVGIKWVYYTTNSYPYYKKVRARDL